MDDWRWTSVLEIDEIMRVISRTRSDEEVDQDVRSPCRKDESRTKGSDLSQPVRLLRDLSVLGLGLPL